MILYYMILYVVCVSPALVELEVGIFTVKVQMFSGCDVRL